jgi:hypothetical protein
MIALLMAAAVGQADAKEVRLDGLSVWKKTGEWAEAGSIGLHPADSKKLVAVSYSEPPKIIFNGTKGKSIDLVSKEEFGDCDLHIEFMVPQGSNSGVYLMGRYEIQVFDSWGKEKVEHSDCGGIYQRWKDNTGYEGRPPKVNASKKPGEWQSFDITFRAPRFDADGKKIENAKFVKVVHNGKVVHENESLSGPTRAAHFEDEKPTGPLMLQGDHGPVAFRNIRIKATGN